jgi:hypothetical protein
MPDGSAWISIEPGGTYKIFGEDDTDHDVVWKLYLPPYRGCLTYTPGGWRLSEHSAHIVFGYPFAKTVSVPLPTGTSRAVWAFS